MQGVAESANRKSERQNGHSIQDGEQDTCLEVANLATNALPPFPKTLEQTGFGQGRTLSERLE